MIDPNTSRTNPADPLGYSGHARQMETLPRTSGARTLILVAAVIAALFLVIALFSAGGDDGTDLNPAPAAIEGTAPAADAITPGADVTAPAAVPDAVPAQQ